MHSAGGRKRFFLLNALSQNNAPIAATVTEFLERFEVGDTVGVGGE